MSELTNESVAVKKRLGRGLGSLLGSQSEPNLDIQTANPVDTHVDTQKTKPVPQEHHPIENTEKNKNQIWQVPIEKLKQNKKQPRQDFDQTKLSELANSIKMHGVIQPIVARRNGAEFEIVAGERRWRAAQMAGLKEVPVLMREASDQKTLEIAIIENIQRADLNPLEEAEAMERLVREYSLTQQDVADRLGKERSSVANVLRILTLPNEVKNFIKSNAISLGHAKVLLSLDNSADQIALAEQIIREKLSVRVAEKLAAKRKTLAGSTAPEISPLSSDTELRSRLVEGLSQELQKLIGTKVSIDYLEGKGRLSIQFYSDEQLTQLVEKMRIAWEK